MTARELADRIRWEMSPHWVELPDDVGSPHKVPSDINSAVALIEAHDAEVRDLGKTVPMEMLWRIAGEGLAANGGRRIDEAKLRGIAARYGYKVEEGTP